MDYLKLKEKYEREKQLRETAFLESQEYLTASKEEREKLKKKFEFCRRVLFIRKICIQFGIQN